MIKLSNVYKAMYGVCFAGSTKNKQRRLVDSVSNNCSQIRDSDGASANSLSTDVLIQASYAAERDAQCDEAIPDNTRYATASSTSDVNWRLAAFSNTEPPLFCVKNVNLASQVPFIIADCERAKFIDSPSIENRYIDLGPGAGSVLI
eukprot:CAMPEP_0114230312 /NCGR_PEP_ID=MMETSP0058-20121206/3397_1 /TAXON_ID=36894 /ORGANISM="Pyramimonas parkeae, CCMP726" /LENGTH=146 /DNA_ID=CAMNT_0001341493 /DNA_START=58 /DNA_END=499 /DNA_ORIENTATION=-